MSTAVSDIQGIQGLVRAHIVGRPDDADPDPSVIAGELIGRLGEEDLRNVAHVMLPKMVKHLLGEMRRATQAQLAAAAAPGASRRTIAAAHQEDGSLSLLRTAWCVDGLWIKLADIDGAGAAWLRDDYASRAEANTAWAKRFALLAKMLKSDEKAESLSTENLEKIFNA